MVYKHEHPTKLNFWDPPSIGPGTPVNERSDVLSSIFKSRYITRRDIDCLVNQNKSHLLNQRLGLSWLGWMESPGS